MAWPATGVSTPVTVTGLALTFRNVRYAAAISTPGIARTQAFCTTSDGACATAKEASKLRAARAGVDFKSGSSAGPKLCQRVAGGSGTPLALGLVHGRKVRNSTENAGKKLERAGKA